MEEKNPRKTSYDRKESVCDWLLAAALSFAGVCALPYACRLTEEVTGYTNSLFAFLLFAALAVFFRRVLQFPFRWGRGRRILPGVFGFFLSLCMVFGSHLDRRGSVPFLSLPVWTAVVVLTILFGITVRYFWERLEKRREAGKDRFSVQKQEGSGGLSRQKQAGSAVAQKRIGGFRGMLPVAGGIWLCYFLVFLAVYPGFFVYDAQEELLQVVTRSFTTHHPLFHVLLMGGTVQLFYKLTGSYNVGIACYTLFQMTVMAGIFGYCVTGLAKRGLSRVGQLLLTLYFGLCPVLVMFSLCSAKDGLFTGALLIMVLLLQELCGEKEVFLKKRGTLLAYAGASLLMMLLRHNGFYAFVVFIPVLTIAWRGQRIKALVYQGLIAAAYLLLSAALTAGFGADSSENQEILTVPIAQMARVYTSCEETLPEEEKEILWRYLPREALERYTPKVTDGVKIGFDNQAYAADKGSFLKLWLKWGWEHPFTYLNAWLMTSYGFWYPDTVIDVYRGNSVFTYTYEDSSYFGYEVEEPGTRISRLPWLNELYRRLSLEVFQQKVPVVSMLFSPGFMFWIMAFGMGFLLYSGEYFRALPFVPLFLCFLTVLLGPTYLVRYVVYWWAAAPIMLYETLGYGRTGFDN